MPDYKNTRTLKVTLILLVGLFAALVATVGYKSRGVQKTPRHASLEKIHKTPVAEQAPDKKPGKPEARKAQQVRVPIEPPRVIDYDRLEENIALSALMVQRKAKYGIQKGVDLIVSADESIRIGGVTVPMQEILDKIRLKKGEVIESELTYRPRNGTTTTQTEGLAEVSGKNLTLSPKPERPSPPDAIQKIEAIKKRQPRGTPQKQKPPRKKWRDLQDPEGGPADYPREITPAEKPQEVEAYGVTVVKPADNLWNIHFTLLKAYFDLKNVGLEPFSDEPDSRGRSSGVGKLLKFSEHMVYIYNVKTRELAFDLDLIHPESKIVVFNMGDVFSLLDSIDYSQINRIRFDGDNLWAPSE